MLSLGRRTLNERVASKVLPFFYAVFFGNIAIGNVVGNDIQNFNSTTDGLDYVTVHSSETLEPGVFNLGLMYNHAVNRLPYVGEGESKQNRLKYNDTLSTLETNIGYGVTENFSASISVPRLMRQKIHGEGRRGEFSGPGFTNIRIGDSVGPEEVNQTLSERRATAVKNWLLKNLESGHGEIEVLGFGESKPLADNGNFQGRQRNRRVEIRVIK